MPIDIPHAVELLAKRDGIQAGLDYLQDKIRERTPVLSGHLRASIGTRKTSPTSGEVYTGLIYAPKQERRTWQVHPHGGQAHYMSSVFAEGEGAFQAIADRIAQG
jgi:hypothetical protein